MHSTPQKGIKVHSTERLDLIASNLELITAELCSNIELEKLINAKVSQNWPPGEYNRNAQEYFRDQFALYGNELTGWLGWYAVKRALRNKPAELIAAAGFFGLPDEYGDVEIGYSVEDQYQGKGYATEIVDALVKIAANDKRVKRVIARTSDNNKASVKVLEKAGFRIVGPVEENKILFEKRVSYL